MSKYYSSSIAFGAEQTKTEQVVVSPTKIGNVTTDAVSGALTVDEVPVLNSLNPVSSDGVARAVIQAGAELPTRSSEDTGKVLTVANSDGDLEWDEPADGIPDMTGKNGKVLGAVDNGGTMEAQWVNPPDSYPSVTGNAGKVLKVNAGATGVEWANESTVTVDQNYNASSTNPQSGTAVAGAISTVKQVPAASSGDFDKILGVTDTSGTVGWVSKPASVSVDQNYNAYSENAQSGTAVAGALSTINQVPASTSADENKVLSVNAQGAPEWVTPSGGTQYSAGDGIGIDANNVISADVDGTTIGIDASTKKIKSLQVIPTKTSDLQNDSGFITSADIPAQVNADWNSSSGASEILHKPDLSIYAQSANLATVATTGDYTDLVNKPTIPAAQINSDWNSSSGVSQILNKPSLATVATTGDYSDLLNKPSIPAAQINADWNSSSGVSEILNKPSLATVATTGAYSDLSGTPTIPSVDQTYNASSTNAQSGVAVASAISGVNAVPASTSVDENKVLTVNSSGTPVWAASSVPASKPLVAGSNITITEGTNDVTIAATDTTYTAGDGIDITSGVVSADVDGSTIGIDSTTKKIKLLSTIPTVDQNYNASSTNAQSGTAVASAISGINAVPASTSADQDKVLTVNSSGTPVWAAAQGGGGSSTPVDLPALSYPSSGYCNVRFEFEDRTIVPTSESSLSGLGSWTQVTADPSRNIWDVSFYQATQKFKNIFTTIEVKILDAYLQRDLTEYFYGCSKLTSFVGRIITGSTLQKANIYELFYQCTGLLTAEIHQYAEYGGNDYYTLTCEDATEAFYGCKNLKTVKLGGFPYSYSNFHDFYMSCNCYRLFSGCVQLESVDGALFWNATSMEYAFNGCKSLNHISSWIFKSTGSLQYCFEGCSCLTNLGQISGSDFTNTFQDCIRLSNVGIVDMASATSAHGAFNNCRSLKEVDIVNSSSITDYEKCFAYCTDFVELPEIDCSSAINVTEMFKGCTYAYKGLAAMYTELSAVQTITSHTNTFQNCGSGTADGTAELAQIPSSWGGTGA